MRLIIAFIAAAAAVALQSCDGNGVSPTITRGLTDFVGRTLSIDDTNEVDALLSHTGVTSYHLGGATAYSSTAEGMFVDTNGLVNVQQVTLESAVLVGSSIGFYGSQAPSVLSTTDSLNWAISGFGNSGYVIKRKKAGSLIFANVAAGDTLYRSQGVTATYNGAHGTGIVEASLEFSSSYTATLVHPDSALIGTASAVVSKVDDGVVTFSAADMSALPTGRIYHLRLAHGRADIYTSNDGRRFGCYSEEVALVPIYLAP